MRKFKIVPLLLLVSIIFMFMLMGLATAQEVLEKVPEKGVFFSTEEDFVPQKPKPSYGNPIISDGDLLNSTGYIYMRNQELLDKFKVPFDLGLDAVDVIDIKDRLVVFSTELDHHKGLFTAGDLLVTNFGIILPNSALLAAFEDIPRELDLGLDAVHFIGNRKVIIKFLKKMEAGGNEYWQKNPEEMIGYLKDFGIDIWFSTEGTAPWPKEPRFLDGDLLSAVKGTIVLANYDALPGAVPAGILDRGVDFGMDAVAILYDPIEKDELLLFSTEINGLLPTFTDGDALSKGDGVVFHNNDLINAFTPRVKDLGLDALSLPILEPSPPCAAEIMRVGGMPVGSINSNGLANGWSATTPPFKAFDSPFGGWAEILGRIPPCKKCVKFKVEYGSWPNSTTPPTSFLALNEPFKEWVSVSGWFIRKDREPDSDGWLPILCNTVMGGLYFPWNTAGKNGKYSLRLTIEDPGGIQYVSSPVVVMIDNIRPKVSLDIKVPKCGDITIGDKVTGKITGIDTHFYSYRLRYESTLVYGLIIPVRKYTSVSDTGDVDKPFIWDTTGFPPCGYRIILEVWDRTIVNNHRRWGEPGYGWKRYDQGYFCLEKAK